MDVQNIAVGRYPSSAAAPGASTRHDGCWSSAALCVAYPGNSYADIATVARTVGLTNPQTVGERIERTKWHSDLAEKLGVKLLTSHIGVIPEDTSSDAYAALVKAVRDIAAAKALLENLRESA